MFSAVHVVLLTLAVISALFAAIPLLGSYWVALPASLYLAIAQQSWIKASLLFGLHFLCYNVVDVAIYSEIKGYVLYGSFTICTGFRIDLYCFGSVCLLADMSHVLYDLWTAVS